MRRPGVEPGPSAWKAEILTTILPALEILTKYLFNKVCYSQTLGGFCEKGYLPITNYTLRIYMFLVSAILSIQELIL